jgi:hypothetical protein
MIDSDADGTQTITDLNVSAKPLDQLKLEARYLGQEKEIGGEDVARQIKFETKPMGSLKTKIIGVYSDQVSDTVSSSSKEARLEMNPLRCATLGGGYLTRDDGNITSTVTDVAGTIKPSQYLELSGSYKNRETTGVEDVESKAVNIALAPAKRVRLTGSYESNPEDKYGAVQQFESKSLGLETRLGSLSLSAAYALKDDYLIGRQAYERRFGADLPLFRHGKLTTGYKESESFQYGQESATTYSLGYQHNVGSSFTFSLTGYLTQYERDRAVLDDQTDYMAETKLGIRF